VWWGFKKPLGRMGAVRKGSSGGGGLVKGKFRGGGVVRRRWRSPYDRAGGTGLTARTRKGRTRMRVLMGPGRGGQIVGIPGGPGTTVDQKCWGQGGGGFEKVARLEKKRDRTQIPGQPRKKKR